MMMRIYRLARWLHLRRVSLVPGLLRAVNRIVFGVVLPPSALHRRNVLLSDRGLSIVVRCRPVIGTGVRIRSRLGHAQAPVIDDNVLIGPGAKVLRPVRIGREASIGVNAVVFSDVPPGPIAKGVQAQVMRTRADCDARPAYVQRVQ